MRVRGIVHFGSSQTRPNEKPQQNSSGQGEIIHPAGEFVENLKKYESDTKQINTYTERRT